MKVLLDMNLTPAWGPFLEAAGTAAVHWSTVGNPSAEDHELMAWAGTEVRCASLPVLLRMKLAANRPKDRSAVQRLREALASRSKR